MMLELRLGELIDLRSDLAPMLPVLAAAGPAPRAALVSVSGDAVALAPGAYCIEVIARARDGVMGPRIAAAVIGGDVVEMELLEVSPGAWRCSLESRRTIASLTFSPGGAREWIFGGGRIETASLEPAPVPTLGGALVIAGRAIFRKLPVGVRRALVASGRRAAWLRRARGASAAGQSDDRERGRFLSHTSDETCLALRADFENRLAVARMRPATSDAALRQPTSHVANVKLVAFHLPQFHPIPENDAWWGKGFTEWSNVAKAAPQFVGHHQPRLPGELGFYDLRTPGVLAAQAALARAHGVSAFCFHYYWFAGKRLLERPIESFLGDRTIDMEFCLCWANENWTRRWDGDEAELLIAQSHTSQDHARVFDDLARHMEDPRYIRVEGKPFLVVYRPAIIANAREMTDLWRREAARRGWPGLFLVASSAFRFDEPGALGFDALVEFPPHGFVADGVEASLHWLNRQHSGAVFDYQAVAAAEVKRMDAARGGRGATVFPGVMPGWDNEARRPGSGTIYHGATPQAYGAWLRAAVDRARRTLAADRRLVFINAWNEWAEGAYLEPDLATGRAFLEETARVMDLP
jgi:hypothetical protein